MHFLVVARTKDHPFWDLLEEALTYDNDANIGKWEQVYGNQDEMIAENKDEINSLVEENNGNLNQAISTFLNDNHLQIGDDNAVYMNVSAQFDYCYTGFKYGNEELEEIMKYKDVVEKTDNSVYAFITADYDFHHTENEKCPFADDDWVYVINGHA